MSVLSGNYSACPQITYSSNFIPSPLFLQSSRLVPFDCHPLSGQLYPLQWVTRPEIILKCRSPARSSKEDLVLRSFSVEEMSIRREEERNDAGKFARKKDVPSFFLFFLFSRKKQTNFCPLWLVPRIRAGNFQGNGANLPWPRVLKGFSSSGWKVYPVDKHNAYPVVWLPDAVGKLLASNDLAVRVSRHCFLLVAPRRFFFLRKEFDSKAWSEEQYCSLVFYTDYYDIVVITACLTSCYL